MHVLPINKTHLDANIVGYLAELGLMKPSYKVWLHGTTYVELFL